MGYKIYTEVPKPKHLVADPGETQDEASDEAMGTQTGRSWSDERKASHSEKMKDAWSRRRRAGKASRGRP